MQLSSLLLLRPTAATMVPSLPRAACQLGLATLTGGSLAAIALFTAQPAMAVPAVEAVRVSQALPTPLPPLPAETSVGTTGAEQYLVLINGNSDLLLQQVRQVEPGAFINYVGGQSVIQAGRFNSYQNAQVRADELASFGIGADVQATDFAGAPIAVTPLADYDLAYVEPVPTSPVPASTVAATPSSIEFGQAAPFGSAAPTTAATLPPPTPTSVSPTSVSPPPLTTPITNNQPLESGYFVVVPGSTAELQTIVSQVIALGAPASIVSARSAPRGPHVAVGPYTDHGIAQEWSNYLRDSGVPGARVHFE